MSDGPTRMAITTSGKADSRRVWPFIAAGTVVVTLTTPFNLYVMLWSWSFIEARYGSYYADNSLGHRLLVAVAMNVALFLTLCIATECVFRAASWNTGRI
jgi:hypothetical protein